MVNELYILLNDGTEHFWQEIYNDLSFISVAQSAVYLSNKFLYPKNKVIAVRNTNNDCYSVNYNSKNELIKITKSDYERMKNENSISGNP